MIALESSPVTDKVTNPSLIRELKICVLSFWPERKNDFFPGPLPVSLERKNFYKLKQFPYLVCVKSDGLRFLLLRFNKIVYFVDRSFTFYKVNIKFDSDSDSNESLEFMLDGELIKTKDGKWSYIAHDCISIYGKDISSSNFDQRYEAVLTIVNDIFIAEGSDIKLAVKEFYKFSEIDKLMSLINSDKINHNIDGLIFTPVTLGIGTQTQYTLFKWKTRVNHTFDLKIVDNVDLARYDAYYQGQNEQIFASVDKNTKDGIHFTKLLKQRCPTFKSGSIVELSFNDELNCFEPLIIRTDKSHPNSLFTIDKTLKNIEENITLDEIVNVIKNKNK